MRKISRTRSSNLDRNSLDKDLGDTRPRGISGATITSWPGTLDVDFDVLFARRASKATITGAVTLEPAIVAHPPAATVSLSDGTHITFATATEFEIAQLG